MLTLLFEDVTSQNNNATIVGKYETLEAAESGMKKHVSKNKHQGKIICVDIEDGHLDAAVSFGGYLRLYRTQ